MVSAALPLGFALVPDDSACHSIVALHREVQRRHPSKFVLEPEQRGLPHVSLFQGQFAASDVPNLTAGLHAVAKKMGGAAIIATPKPPEIWAEKIVFLDVDVEADLLSWQHEIMKIAEPMRQREKGPADRQALRGLSRPEQASYDHFQYPFVGDALRPHFTIGRLESEADKWSATRDELLSLSRLTPKIIFPRFVLFEVGPFGTLERVVEGIPLNAPKNIRFPTGLL